MKSILLSTSLRLLGIRRIENKVSACLWLDTFQGHSAAFVYLTRPTCRRDFDDPLQLYRSFVRQSIGSVQRPKTLPADKGCVNGFLFWQWPKF